MLNMTDPNIDLQISKFTKFVCYIVVGVNTGEFQGQTGFPWIDAIMIQLRDEGWIHHLARHAVACFLTRGDLWISWEEGMKASLFVIYLVFAYVLRYAVLLAIRSNLFNLRRVKKNWHVVLTIEI